MQKSDHKMPWGKKAAEAAATLKLTVTLPVILAAVPGAAAVLHKF